MNSDKEDTKETFPCPSCKEDAVMVSYNCYYEYYVCENCNYEFKVN